MFRRKSYLATINPSLSKFNLSEEIGNEIVKKAQKCLEDLIDNQTYDAQIGEQSPKSYYSKIFNRDDSFDLALSLIDAAEKQPLAKIYGLSTHIAIRTKLTNFILQEVEKHMDQQPLPQLLKEENEYTLKKEDKSALEKMCPDYSSCVLKSDFHKAIKKFSDKLTNQEIEQLFTDLGFEKLVTEVPQNNSKIGFDTVMKQYELGTEVPRNNSQIVNTSTVNLTVSSQKVATENLSNVVQFHPRDRAADLDLPTLAERNPNLGGLSLPWLHSPWREGHSLRVFAFVTGEQIVSSLVKLVYPTSKLTKKEITDFIADLGVDLVDNWLPTNKKYITKLTFLTALDKISDKLTQMQIDQLIFDLDFSEAHKKALRKVLADSEKEAEEARQNHPKILAALNKNQIADSGEIVEIQKTQLNQIKEKFKLLQANFKELQNLLSELK